MSQLQTHATFSKKKSLKKCSPVSQPGYENDNIEITTTDNQKKTEVRCRNRHARQREKMKQLVKDKQELAEKLLKSEQENRYLQNKVLELTALLQEFHENYSITAVKKSTDELFALINQVHKSNT